MNVRRDTYVDKVLTKQCSKCNSIRPPQAYHCPICERCMAYMDHHCPWVNNCVALYTQKPFILFLLYTSLALTLSLVVNLSQGYDDIQAAIGNGPRLPPVGFWVCVRAFTMMESVPFLMFMSVVFFDQICIVLNRPSTLERIRHHEFSTPKQGIQFKRRGYKNFMISFGGPFSLKWFLPTVIEGTFEMEELYE